jgi:hypothetical protein
MEDQIGTKIMDLFTRNSNAFDDYAHLLTATDKKRIEEFSNSPQLRQKWLFGKFLKI